MTRCCFWRARRASVPPVASSCHVIVQKGLSGGNESSLGCCLISLTGPTGTAICKHAPTCPFLFVFRLTFPSMHLHIPALSSPCSPSRWSPFFPSIHTHMHHRHHRLRVSRETSASLWSLRLTVPAGPEGNDRGTVATPAPVLNRAGF